MDYDIVPAIVAISGLAFLVCVPFGLFAEMGLLSILLIAFGLLGTLQVGYLAGVVVAGAWARTRSSPADVIKDDDPNAVLETTPTAPPLRRVSGAWPRVRSGSFRLAGTSDASISNADDNPFQLLMQHLDGTSCGLPSEQQQ